MGNGQTDFNDALYQAFASVKDCIEQNLDANKNKIDYARVILYTDGEGSLPDRALDEI